MNVSPVVPPNVRVRTSGGELASGNVAVGLGLEGGLWGKAVGESELILAEGVAGFGTTVLAQAAMPNTRIADRRVRATI